MTEGGAACARDATSAWEDELSKTRLSPPRAQDDGGRIIECVEGSFSNVVGLPVERTLTALKAHFA
jgi:predicted house-cleaning NTP pyrophosphatase (Maf/HAM1 superfamily)